MSKLTIQDFFSVKELVMFLPYLQQVEGLYFEDLEENEVYIFGTMNVIQVNKCNNSIIRLNLNCEYVKEEPVRTVFREAIYYKLEDILKAFSYSILITSKEDLTFFRDQS